MKSKYETRVLLIDNGDESELTNDNVAAVAAGSTQSIPYVDTAVKQVDLTEYHVEAGVSEAEGHRKHVGPWECWAHCIEGAKESFRKQIEANDRYDVRDIKFTQIARWDDEEGWVYEKG